MLLTKHVGIGAVSTHVQTISHVVHLQYVPSTSIEQRVNVLRASRETLIGNVAKVSHFFKLVLFKKYYVVGINSHTPTIRKLSVKLGECQHDDECPDNNACIENQCLDPCSLTEPCGKQAICKTSSHRPVCRCPSNWAGNPHEECFQCRSFTSRLNS